MAFGILEDHKLHSVPGTGLLSAKARQVTVGEATELKCGTGKYSHIVLIPQPSCDSHDPLNWPRWKKEVCFWTLVFATSLEGALYSLATAGYVLLAKEFNVSVDEIASSFSAFLLGIAMFTLVQNTLAFKYGLRLVFLLSTFLMFMSCLWNALSPDLASIRASRVFQGFGMAAPQALVPTAIEHVFFENDKTNIKKNPPTFLRQLKIYNGTFSDESVWKIFLRPFPFVLSPVTWFIFLSYSMPLVWFGLVSLCSSTIFVITDHFNAAQVGLTHLAGFVGVVLAISVTALNDWAIIWMSQRNRGVYEPEYRLIFMLSMLFGVFGYVGWAVGSDHHMPWIGSVVCITMMNVSLVISGGAAVTYLLDTHRENALHILSITTFAREMVFYGSTFFANGFILSRGIKLSLLILGACQAVCWLVCIPMYVYGKRVRSFIARHPRLFRGDLTASDAPQAQAAASTGTDSKRWASGGA
ncbi:MFS general substrate transporter [Ganoderma leucocontextum]|nr:MFS general substrate transporter [Ganoderma leucocontextum]